MRSRAAASLLRNAGFLNVSSMAGGIKNWNGLKASGPPEAGMSFFLAAGDAGEVTALAWLLEEGSRVFYSEISAMQTEPEAAALFNDLVKAEEQHKGSLLDVYRGLTGVDPGKDFPSGLAIAESGENHMEGNVSVAEAVVWARGKSLVDLLELCISLETDSYDRYIKMSRRAPDEDSRKVFDRLVTEEKRHLARMTEMLDKKLT